MNLKLAATLSYPFLSLTFSFLCKLHLLLLYVGRDNGKNCEMDRTSVMTIFSVQMTFFFLKKKCIFLKIIGVEKEGLLPATMPDVEPIEKSFFVSRLVS